MKSPAARAGRRRPAFWLALALLCAAVSLRAQSGEGAADPEQSVEEELPARGPSDGEDPLEGELFEEDMFEEIETDAQNPAPEQDLLLREEIAWSGSYRGTVSADWSWDSVGTGAFDLADPPDRSLAPAVGLDLSLDARPDSRFRVFGKLRVAAQPGGAGVQFGAITNDTIIDNLPDGWTAEENEDGETEIRNEEGVLILTLPAEESADGEEETEEEPGTGTVPALELSVVELFADFTWLDRLFFRFGKHTIQWGVGYFWSPADVLNLTAVDPEDPTADREGPVSLKIHYPFGLHNAYLYLVANDGIRPRELAVAPKLELALGKAEIAVAGYYQSALSPRVLVMGTATLGEVDLFGEAALSWGSDRVFVRPSRDQGAALADLEDELELVLDTYEAKNLPFFQGTAGFRYLEQWSGERGSLFLAGQYYFNGTGYRDSSLLVPAVRLLGNPGESGLAIEDEAARPEGYEAPPALRFSDISGFGMHYAALAVGLSEILGTGLSVSLFGLANLNDLSGIASATVSYELFDRLTLSASVRMTFGEPGDEYTNLAALLAGTTGEEGVGSTLSITVEASLGGGRF